MEYYINTYIGLLIWFVCYAIAFKLLVSFWASDKSQPFWRDDKWTDIGFFFLLPPLYNIAQFAITAFSFSWIKSAPLSSIFFPEDALPLMSQPPIWLQFITIVVLVDFLQYWTHRFSHTKYIWKFHSIHHSSKTIDWLSSVRWHPVNALFHTTLVIAVVWSFGFSVISLFYAGVFMGVNGALVHANLNWTYGPLRYVFASPIYHRWHHTSPAEGGEKNFAPFFAFFDIIFGTYYMPKGKVPTDFGAHNDTVPDDFIGQLVYPFRKGAKPVK